MPNLNTLQDKEFSIGGLYTRKTIPEVGKVPAPKNPRDWTGIVEFKNCFIFFVTLDKKSHSANAPYNDYFIDSGKKFQWDSQSKNTQQTRTIQRIIGGVPCHLFVRIKDKINSKTQPFVYAGELGVRTFHGNKPVSFEFDVKQFAPTNNRLKELYDWSTTLIKGESSSFDTSAGNSRNEVRESEVSIPDSSNDESKGSDSERIAPANDSAPEKAAERSGSEYDLNAPHFAYLFKQGSLGVKVGFTSDVDRRLREINAYHVLDEQYFQLVILHQEENAQMAKNLEDLLKERLDATGTGVGRECYKLNEKKALSIFNNAIFDWFSLRKGK